jgi:hypothetical protein
MTNNSRGTFPLAKILDDEYARILDNFTLVKTVVYKKKRIWNIYVNAGTYIDHEKIQLLEKHINSKFPQLAVSDLLLHTETTAVKSLKIILAGYGVIISQTCKRGTSLIKWLDRSLHPFLIRKHT